MIFLEPEEDLMATLEEALAFIDTCDSSSPCDVAMKDAGHVNDVVSKQSGVDTALGLDGFKLDEHADDKELHGTKEATVAKEKAATATKNMRRREPGASTKLQRRKKAEILSLREQGKQLEAQLEELKRARRERYQYAHRADSKPVWPNVVAAEYEERLKAKKTNRELKAIFANQLKLHNTVRALLQRPNTYQGMERLLQFGFPHVARSPVSDADGVMAQLRQRVQGLYLDAESVLPSDVHPTISSQMVVKPHQQHGKVIELATTTPLSCTVLTAAQIIWRNLASAKEHASELNSLERNCAMPVPAASGTLGLHKLHVVRKFEEADRVVVVWSAVMVHHDLGVQFRDHAWIAITRSERTPLGGCLVQARLQLFPETSAGGDSSPVLRLSAIQDAALSAVGEKFRQCFQGMQNTMLEQSGEMATPTVIAV